MKHILIASLLISTLIAILSARSGIGHFPGDIMLSGKNWRIYFPVGLCLFLSLVLSLLLALFKGR